MRVWTVKRSPPADELASVGHALRARKENLQRAPILVDRLVVTESSHDNSWFAECAAFQARLQPHVDAWIATLGVCEGPGGNVYRSAAHSLLRVPEVRGEGPLPDEPDREPLTWNEIDPYEVLFGSVIHGGCFTYDPREFLTLIGSLAEHLGQAGVIPAAEHAAFVEAWPAWFERALDVFETGSWYERDGTRIAPETIRRANEEAVAREVRRSRFGKFRRRCWPVRR